VVYAPGWGGTPLTHTPGAEYLASHGYVVAMSPSQGDSPIGVTFDEAGQEQQVRDLELAVGAMRERAEVDASRVALVGFSFGGGAVLVEAMRAPSISAVVVLDGTPVFQDASDIVRRATGFDPAAVRAPVLVVTSDHLRDEDLTIVQSLAVSDRRVVRFKAVDHHDFIASPIFAGVVRGAATPSARRAFPLVARAMLRFIEAGVRRTAIPTDLVPSPRAAALPGEPVSELVLARLDAPSRDQLIAMIVDRVDVAGVIEIQHAFSKRGGVPLLTAGTLYMLGVKLLERGLADKAIALFELLVELYPGHFRTLNLLGDLYREHGDPTRAEQRYRTSLAVKPGNGGAISGLELLERPPAELIHIARGRVTNPGESSRDSAYAARDEHAEIAELTSRNQRRSLPRQRLLRVIERGGDEVAYMVVGETVVDVLTVAPALHDALGVEHAQLLRQRGQLRARARGELGDTPLVVASACSKRSRETSPAARNSDAARTNAASASLGGSRCGWR